MLQRVAFRNLAACMAPRARSPSRSTKTSAKRGECPEPQLGTPIAMWVVEEFMMNVVAYLALGLLLFGALYALTSTLDRA